MSESTKSMGLWSSLSLVIGNMIGSGIFLLPATLAVYGQNSILGWILTSIGGILLASVFFYLAQAYPKAGGPYVYPKQAFGPMVGTIVAFGYWTSLWIGNSAAALGAVSYLAELIPLIKLYPAVQTLTALALIGMLSLLNYKGIKSISLFQIITTIIKILPLLMILGLGLWVLFGQKFELIQFQPVPWSFDSIITSAGITLWALLGLESATVPADHIENPSKNIPIACLAGILATCFFYISTYTIILSLIPVAQLTTSTAPFADAMTLFLGHTTGQAMAFFAFVSTLGSLGGCILLQSHMSAVMAQGELKSASKRSKNQIQKSSIWINASLTGLVVIANYGQSITEVFSFMIQIATSACLIMYLACALSLFKLSLNKTINSGSNKKILVLALAASTYACFGLYGLGLNAFFGLILLLALSFFAYLFKDIINKAL